MHRIFSFMINALNDVQRPGQARPDAAHLATEIRALSQGGWRKKKWTLAPVKQVHDGCRQGIVIGERRCKVGTIRCSKLLKEVRNRDCGSGCGEQRRIIASRFVRTTSDTRRNRSEILQSFQRTDDCWVSQWPMEQNFAIPKLCMHHKSNSRKTTALSDGECIWYLRLPLA